VKKIKGERSKRKKVQSWVPLPGWRGKGTEKWENSICLAGKRAKGNIKGGKKRDRTKVWGQ